MIVHVLQGYGNQEEDDMDGWGAGGGGDVGSKDKLSAKHKSRTISINPTEGFQYSDVYFVRLLFLDCAIFRLLSPPCPLSPPFLITPTLFTLLISALFIVW